MPVERFQAPTGGTTPHTAPTALSKVAALELENFLVDRPGKVAARGRMTSPPAGTLLTVAVPTASTWVFGEQMMVSVEPTSKFTDGLTGFSNIATGPDAVLDGRSARWGDAAYGPSTTGKFLRWTGDATVPVDVPVAPRLAADVAVHLNRLFVAGGSEPNTATPRKRATLWWTDGDRASPSTLAKWQDDVSGLTNQIVVGEEGDGIVALASVGRQLLVFKRDSIWTVLGDTPATFTVRRLTNRMGLQNKRALCVFDESVMFMTVNGLVLFDGSSFTPVEGHPREVGPYDGTIVRLPNNYFMFASVTSDETWYFHLPTQAWMKFSSPLPVNNGFVAVVATERGVPFGYDGKALYDLSTMTAYQTDIPVLADLDNTGTPTYRAYTARWTTRLAQVALPTHQAKALRLFLDHNTDFPVPGAGGPPAWTVEVKDGRGATIATIPKFTAVDPGQPFLAQRERATMNVEVTDAVITVRYDPNSTNPAPLVDTAELFDVWLEYEPTNRPGPGL